MNRDRDQIDAERRREPDPEGPNGAETDDRTATASGETKTYEERQSDLDEALADTFPASDPPAVRPNKASPDPAPGEGPTEPGD